MSNFSITRMDVGGLVATGFLVGGLAFGLWRDTVNHAKIYAELCPTILALSPTAADSLAVFREHEGCFEFVQTEAP